MSWDGDRPALLTKTRLLAMSPEAVYDALQKYGAYQDDDPSYFSFRADKELEKALLNRNHPLINLALAEFGGVDEVGAHLWNQVVTVEAGDEYNRAIRLALFRNPHHLRQSPLGAGPFGIVPMEDLQRIVGSTDRDEIVALLNNPGAKKLLGLFAQRKAPFDSVAESKFLSMVELMLKSPSLTDNRDNEHGPDFGSWDIQDGILNLLETFPVSERALEMFHWLLSSINPEHVRTPPKDPRPMFKRWQDLKVSEKFKERYAEPMGRYTSMDFQDEFVCLVASLYGSHFVDSKVVGLGSIDDPDPVMRYCYYGRSSMKPEEMEKAWNRDQDGFMFAILHGYCVSTDKERAVIESHLHGTHQINLYYKRLLNRRKKRWGRAEPVRAVTENGQELLEMLPHYKGDLTEDSVRLLRVQQQLPLLSAQAKKMTKLLEWSVILLVVLLILSVKHTW